MYNVWAELMLAKYFTIIHLCGSIGVAEKAPGPMVDKIIKHGMDALSTDFVGESSCRY
jgi:hypothetical protein